MFHRQDAKDAEGGSFEITPWRTPRLRGEKIRLGSCRVLIDRQGAKDAEGEASKSPLGDLRVFAVKNPPRRVNYQLKSNRMATRSESVAPNTASELVMGWIQSNITRVRSDQYQLNPNVKSLYWPALTLLRSK